MITPAIEIALRLRGSSYRKLAKELGCSAGHLNHVANNKKPPGDDLLEALGLERITKVIYRRKRNGHGTEHA